MEIGKANMDKEQLKSTFSQWVNLYTHELYSWAVYKTSSPENAEDLVQDTFLAAYKSIENYNNKSTPKTWLIAILNNKIIDYYRKNKVTSQVFISIDEEKANNYSDSIFDENGSWKSKEVIDFWNTEKHLLDNPLFNEIMEKCMTELPEKWSVAITLKYLLEKETSIICQELGITKTNYWQVMHRAKLLLKTCIEKKWKP